MKVKYNYTEQHEANLRKSDAQLNNTQKRAIDNATGSISQIACKLGLMREYVQAHICLRNLQ
jgi:hypothetical protein